MTGKLKNPYWGLSEEARWELYEKQRDMEFFLRRDFLFPQKPKVLAVDHKAITFFLKRELEGAFGEEVDEAHHAAEVLERAKSKAYDLILSFSRILPGGVRALMEGLATIPYGGVALLHTALPHENAAHLMMQTDMDGFILKGDGLPQFMKAMGWAQGKRT